MKRYPPWSNTSNDKEQLKQEPKLLRKKSQERKQDERQKNLSTETFLLLIMGKIIGCLPLKPGL
jgi:hypothetical protein